MNPIANFISGASAMGFFIIAGFFFNFWKKTSDRLFFIFGLAFLIMTVERIALLYYGAISLNEMHPLVYLFRLVGFILILFAIYDKNRKHA
jgi:hypothetical protein